MPRCKMHRATEGVWSVLLSYENPNAAARVHINFQGFKCQMYDIESRYPVVQFAGGNGSD
jgi:hypothetical protein